MKYPTYIGNYVPHRPVNQDNRRLNRKTGELELVPSLTKVSFQAECDINNIIRDFKVTGQIAHINAAARQGAYLDLPDTLDFQQSLDQVRQAQAAFATLPAKVRARFANDPAQFLAFLADPENTAEAIALGLAQAPPQEPPPAPPPPPSGGAGGTGG